MATKIPRSFPSDVLRKFQDRPCFWWKSGGRRVSRSWNIRWAGKAINEKTQISFNRQINKQRKEFETLHNTIFKTKFRALPKTKKTKLWKEREKGKLPSKSVREGQNYLSRVLFSISCFLFLCFKSYYKSSKRSTFRIRALTNSIKMTTSTNQTTSKRKSERSLETQIYRRRMHLNIRDQVVTASRFAFIWFSSRLTGILNQSQNVEKQKERESGLRRTIDRWLF